MGTSKTAGSTPRLSEVARHVVIPKGIVTTAWPRVVAKCADLGVTFDSWQHGVGSIALGKRKDGKYAATVGGIVLSIPRQVGKTFLVGMIVIALCLLNPGYTVLWSAHRSRTATKTFATLKAMTSRKLIKPLMLEPRNTNGEQEIRFVNGSVIMFGARELGFGRGFDEVDAEVFDEAQILTEKALEDMVPAANQSRHPAGALLFFMGTPPRPSDPGEEFTNRRSKALAGATDSMVYVEFSADRGADADDHAQWSKANPSYPSRTPLESMLRMREQLTDAASFYREALGVWDEVGSKPQWTVIAKAEWDSRKVLESPADGRVAYGLDMSPDRSSLSVGVAVRPVSGPVHLEVAARWPGDAAGSPVDWLVERWPKASAVVIDYYSPAMSLKPELEARHVKVTVTQAPDMAKACGMFFDAVRGEVVTHFDQKPLNAALAGATKRDIGQAGGWGWNRKDPSVDLTGLVAVTLALYGVMTSKRRPTGGRSSGRAGVVL